MSATRLSVVSTIAATLAAFCSAERGHLGRIDDAALDHIHILALERVIAIAVLVAVLDVLHDHAPSIPAFLLI